MAKIAVAGNGRMVRPITATEYAALGYGSLTPQEFFDRQVAVLTRARLCDREQCEPLVARIPREQTLFLVVPPKPAEGERERLPLTPLRKNRPQPDHSSELDELIRLTGVTVNNLFPSPLKDSVTVPERPYLAVAVEDGRLTVGEAPDAVLKRLRPLGRSALTWFEGFILCLLFPVLSHHGVSCAVTRYGQNHVPNFSLRNGRLIFEADWSRDGHPRIGVASLRGRISG